MARRDDGRALVGSTGKRLLLGDGAGDGIGQVLVAGLEAAEIHLKVGQVPAGAGHLTLGHEHVLAQPAQPGLILDEETGRVLDLGGLLPVGCVGGAEGAVSGRTVVGAAAQPRLELGDLPLRLGGLGPDGAQTLRKVVGTEIGGPGPGFCGVAVGTQGEQSLLVLLDGERKLGTARSGAGEGLLAHAQ